MENVVLWAGCRMRAGGDRRTVQHRALEPRNPKTRDARTGQGKNRRAAELTSALRNIHAATGIFVANLLKGVASGAV
jgi:hypothetical protein